MSSIQVTPSILQIDLIKDKSEFELTYKNNTPSTVSLTFRSVDFKDLTEGERINFLEPSATLDNRYNLANWLSFDRQTILLNPGETRIQKVTIQADKLAAGGHYASIQAVIGSDQNSQDNLKLQGVLSSIVFVRAKTGHEKELGEINFFKIERQGYSLPTTATVKFHNLGNVETVPYSSLTISDPLGHPMGRAILNEGSLITLPETIRRYDGNISYFRNSILPGLYKASLQVKYGPNLLLSREESFFSFGSQPVLFVFFACVVGVISIQLYKKRKLSRN